MLPRFIHLLRVPITLCALLLMPAVYAEDVLSSLQWQHRVFLVEGGNDVEAILTVLEDARDDIDERHVVWFVLTADKVLTNYRDELSGSFASELRAQFFAQGPYRAVLIGKDGGVKRRYLQPDVAGMLALIDTMPMRRREMRDNDR